LFPSKPDRNPAFRGFEGDKCLVGLRSHYGGAAVFYPLIFPKNRKTVADGLAGVFEGLMKKGGSTNRDVVEISLKRAGVKQ
jgi:hypothetical protein